MEAQKKGTTRPRSRRLYVCWGIALALLLVAALVCWLMVVPVWRVRRAVLSCPEFGERLVLLNEVRVAEEAIESLGGPERALPGLRCYWYSLGYNGRVDLELVQRHGMTLAEVVNSYWPRPKAKAQ